MTLGTTTIAALREHVGRLVPGAEVVSVEPLGADAGAAAHDATEKGFGYGVPLRIAIRTPAGAVRRLVFHVAAPNEFGHDRRSDRARDCLLAFDTFGLVPDHVHAVDVGFTVPGGALRSARDAGEAYLITEFADGEPYAEDLRRIARTGEVTPRDAERCARLVRYLADLHRDPVDDRTVYARSIRDLVGSGEGVYGIVDGYPPDVPAAPAERLGAIERRCADWRWRLRGSCARLARIHGDFHPFNILFDADDRLALLDTSRGSAGDPADDATCLAINYLFFGVTHPGAWQRALSGLWRAFWSEYLAATGDRALLSAAPPFFAWRALVLGNPRWYPAVTPAARDLLLRAAELALATGALDPEATAALVTDGVWAP
jgi:hypothetical protein